MIVVPTKLGFSGQKWPITEEASTLGFQPGCWPVRLILQDPMGAQLRLQLGQANLTREGDVESVSYAAMDGTSREVLVVIND